MANAAHIWINEFHYDNLGTDTGEFVEIALKTPNVSGFTFADYSVVLYNGNGGAAYSTRSLTEATSFGPFPIAGSTSLINLFVLNYPSNGIQNGAPDGIALVNSTNNTVESFLSYEGTFEAVGGIADGVTSTDVGVAETNDDPIGGSLSAIGFGDDANDFNASSFANTPAPGATPGGINTGQTFSTIPEPSTALLGGLGLLALLRRRR